ncbi:protein of unknown function [Streptococcus thermophilus]|nr:protein of unknown function [Streptococcus thermophilus]
MEDIMPKNVLITGATSGIGEATAYAFSKEGENVILTGRRVERLEALKEELQATLSRPKKFGPLHWMLLIWRWSRTFAKPFSKVWVKSMS